MLYIIIGLILLGIIASAVGGILPLILIVILIIVLSVCGLWPYFLGFAAILLIISMLADVGKSVFKGIKEWLGIYQKTQTDMQKHNNDAALMEELSKNCCWLGYMNDDMWRKKLPNYVNRQYSTEFVTVTRNFAKQIEQQHILQNDDWFEPFKLYVLKHPGGSTVTKMLHEVNCPQLKMTHATSDRDLLNTWLDKGTKKTNEDVPALFYSVFIPEMNEYLFTPTPYLCKLYGDNDGETKEVNHDTEIDFDDL